MSLPIPANLIASPAPAKPFWQVGPYPLQLSGSAGTTSIRLELEHPKRTFLHPSPAKDQFKYPEIMVSSKLPSTDYLSIH